MNEKLSYKNENITVMKCNHCLEGLVTANNMKCVLCEKVYCHKCHEEKISDHTCDINLVENIKFLNKDTKPSSKCAIPIHKINRCEQMWCVECHSTFS